MSEDNSKQVTPRPTNVVSQRYTPGHQFTSIHRHVTQKMIDGYAKASGDFNPIHVDPEQAKNGPFGRTIAHGLMTLALVAQILNDWSEGNFDNNGELAVTFVGPVYVDDHIEVSGEVLEILEDDGRLVAKCRVSCMAGDRAILVGTAQQFVFE
jgi:3-hydroxybutyryl-CoA dehydratase